MMRFRLSIVDQGGQELSFAMSPVEMEALPDDPTEMITELVRQAAFSPALIALRESVERRKRMAAKNVATKMTNGQS
jgi:hypothetical protein